MLIAASLGTPNKAIGSHTVALIRSIQDRGYAISRLTMDRGYNAGTKKEDLLIPLREMGVEVVVDYKKLQRGPMGHARGAIQAEGHHYCPATPEELLNATPDMDQKLIDFHTYQARLGERKLYRPRPKEKRDEQGRQPMMCPAYGPSATVECPLKKMHPKARASTKPKALILQRNLPAHPDEICTKDSVTFPKNTGIEHAQKLDYARPEWRETYVADRNSMESMNDYLKDGPEQLDDSALRRMRGLAAQQFFVAMMVTSANLRKISRYLRDKLRSKPKKSYPRRRDTENRSTYVRWFDKPERVDFDQLPDELKRRQ